MRLIQARHTAAFCSSSRNMSKRAPSPDNVPCVLQPSPRGAMANARAVEKGATPFHEEKCLSPRSASALPESRP